MFDLTSSKFILLGLIALLVVGPKELPTLLRNAGADNLAVQVEQMGWDTAVLDEVSQALRTELLERFGKAGVTVDEARLTHLAYAPEIAQAMLRRQQAEAVIAARQKIVQGAVSMVDMALKELADKHVVQLDDERRAAMVSNLLVVLCGDRNTQPVVNAGTIYQ